MDPTSSVVPDLRPDRPRGPGLEEPHQPWGRYRSQYVWRCPHVTCRNTVVEPGWLPAAAAIDWTLLGERIGDRIRPLAAKTLQRIAAGLARYCRVELLVPVEGRDGKTAAPASETMRTMTTRNETGLLVPAGGTGNDAATPLGAVMRTRTTRESEALVVPLRNNNTTKPPVNRSTPSPRRATTTGCSSRTTATQTRGRRPTRTAP